MSTPSARSRRRQGRGARAVLLRGARSSARTTSRSRSRTAASATATSTSSTTTGRSSRYPLVPGHEIVGRVAAARRARSRTCSVGQRGRRRLAAQRVPRLRAVPRRPREPVPDAEATCVGHHGGLAERIRADGRFAFAIPDGARRRGGGAAPVRRRRPCSRRMRRFGISAHEPVGVIGIGGLGHMALACCARWAPRSPRSRRRPTSATRRCAMGAHDFVGSTDAREIRKHAGPLRSDPLDGARAARLDHLPADAAPERHPLPARRAARADPDPAARCCSRAALDHRQRHRQPRRHRARCSRFAARHRIAPQIETQPMAEVNAAIDAAAREPGPLPRGARG